MKQLLIIILLTAIGYTVFDKKAVEFPKQTPEQILEYRLRQARLWDKIDVLILFGKRYK